jgi:LCP family protein required for cell wall assembly
MDCREARRLLDEGVKPGSSGPVRPALGFHLAGCADCRRYREAPEEQQLLADLLGALPEPPRPVPVPSSLARSPAWAWLRNAGRVAAVAAAVAALLIVGWTTVTLARIRGNVQQMIAPTPPLVTMAPFPAQAAAATPASSQPSATPLPVLVPPPPTALEQPAAVPVGAEPTNLPPTATSAAWPTAWPANAATVTLTPVPLGGEAQLATTPVPLGGEARLAPTPLPQLGFGASPPAPSGAMTVLLLGLDRRPGEGAPARSDAIIVARLEPERRRIALLSLPRDLIVEIPGYGYGRINAASVYGELNPQLGGGVALARTTVSSLLGIPIDHVVTIDFEGFIQAIDALGGVTIDVPTELYDAAYPTMDYGYQTVHFLPGVQQMDGATALKYARLRHADSDFERSKRQQQVIIAAVAQVRGQNVVDQLNSLAAITAALRGYLFFDIPEDRLVSLVWSFRDITPEQVERYALGANQVFFGAPDDPYAGYAAPGAIKALTRQLMSGPE